MIIRRSLFILSICLPVVANSQVVCRPADDLSANLIQQLSDMLTTGDSLRMSLTVPVVPASQVTLVTNEATCTRAREVQDSVIASSNSSYLPPYPSRPLYVVSVGTYYASLDTSNSEAEWRSVYIWDDHWRFLGFFLY